MEKLFFIMFLILAGCEIKVAPDIGGGLKDIANVSELLINSIPQEGKECDDGSACSHSDIFVKKSDGRLECEGISYPGCMNCETDADCPAADTILCLHEEQLVVKYTGVCPQEDSACMGNFGCAVRAGECEIWMPDEYEKCLGAQR